MYGYFKTRRLITCLDPKHRIVAQCKNIVNILNEYKTLQPKLENMEMSVNEHNEENYISKCVFIDELIQIETDEIVVHECPSQIVMSV